MKVKVFLFWILGLLAFLSLVFSIFYFNFSDKIYPGTSAAGINVGGLTIEQAEKLIAEKVSFLEEQGFVFKDDSRLLTLYPAASSIEGALPLASLSAAKTAQAAWDYGHQGNFLENTKQLLSRGIFFYRQDLVYELEEDLLLDSLKTFFSPFEDPREDAKLEFYAVKNPAGEEVSFSVSKEKIGQSYNYQEAIETLKKDLKSGNLKTINLELTIDYPEIYSNQTAGAVDKAQELLQTAPLELLFIDPLNKKEKTFIIKKSELASWIGLEKRKDQVEVVFSEILIEKYLEEKISSSTSQEPILPRFEIKNGRVGAFAIGSDGYRLDVQASLEEIIKVLEQEEKKVLLVTTLIKNEKADDVNSYQIQEIVGTGSSNFAGSPANRRYNIKIGAKALGGLLIKPDEEFSLVSALGEINAETGYLPELVIKDNRTIPEYGGGLCQIATTLFRTALEAGLPITARRNHSYRVSYYEPAGTDAAVYIPNPDVKFVNDTGNYLLIQYRIEGDNIYFDFWGKKDGRQVEITSPVIYNIVRPASTLIIESPDLKPGEKKCTEKAHNGADAYFDYKVVYNPEKTIEKRFTSHYVPWREVCLVGISPEIENATSSEAVAR